MEFSANQVRQLLADKCKAAGGQAHWAKKHKVSPAYVSDVLLKRRAPGEAIARALGLEERRIWVSLTAPAKKKG